MHISGSLPRTCVDLYSLTDYLFITELELPTDLVVMKHRRLADCLFFLPDGINSVIDLYVSSKLNIRRVYSPEVSQEPVDSYGMMEYVHLHAQLWEAMKDEFYPGFLEEIEGLLPELGKDIDKILEVSFPKCNKTNFEINSKNWIGNCMYVSVRMS